jgi:hypothetical protein
MGLHEANPNIDYEAKFAKPLSKELKKYPMLGGNVLNSLWSDDQRKLVAEYIDTIEEAQVLTMM